MCCACTLCSWLIPLGFPSKYGNSFRLDPTDRPSWFGTCSWSAKSLLRHPRSLRPKRRDMEMLNVLQDMNFFLNWQKTHLQSRGELQVDVVLLYLMYVFPGEWISVVPAAERVVNHAKVEYTWKKVSSQMACGTRWELLWCLRQTVFVERLSCRLSFPGFFWRFKSLGSRHWVGCKVLFVLQHRCWNPRLSHTCQGMVVEDSVTFVHRT